MAGRERSGVGKAKTMPAAGAALAGVKFGVLGCQAYESGFYTAHRKVADEDLDFIYCYGDYIYEGRGNRIYGARRRPTRTCAPISAARSIRSPTIASGTPSTRWTPTCRRAHASAAWFTIWDDHEIDNNWVTDIDQDGTDPQIFALRQAAAMQAYYEHMPLRKSSFPRGSAMQLYRRARSMATCWI